MAKSFQFGELLNNLSKINPDIKLIDESPFSEITEWIPSGNYALNAQLSGSLYGGYPVGRITQIAGASQSGKTYLCLNAAREAIKKGYNVIYIDTEAAIDKEMMPKMGIDTSKFAYIPLSIIGEVKTFLANMFKDMEEKQKKGFDIPKVLLVIDSIGQLMSDKEWEDAISGSDKSDMTKQKELKSLFRIMTVSAGKLKIPILITNHTYNSMSFIPMQIVSGGTGNKYSSTITLMLSKAKDGEDANKNTTSFIVTSKVDKQRKVRPITIKFVISTLHALNPYIGIQNFCSFDKHGIGPGYFVEETQLNEKGKKVPTGKLDYEFDASGKTWAVAHLNTTIKSSKIMDFYNSKVFTEDVLEKLELFIKEFFAFPDYNESGDSVSDVENLLLTEEVNLETNSKLSDVFEGI